VPGAPIKNSKGSILHRALPFLLRLFIDALLINALLINALFHFNAPFHCYCAFPLSYFIA